MMVEDNVPHEDSGALGGIDQEDEESGLEDDYDFVAKDRPAKRPAVFSFNNRLRAGMAARERAINPTEAQDDYFKSIMSRMDKEMEENSEDEEEQSQPQNASAPPGREEPPKAILPNNAAAGSDVHPAGTPVRVAPPTTDGVPLSSEWAPADERFEIDEELLNERMAAVGWFDDDLLGEEDLEEARGIESFIKENVSPSSNQVDQPSHPLANATTHNDQQLLAPLSLDQLRVEVEPALEPTAASTTALAPSEGGGGLVKFYWLDAYEKPNGTIFLFGKIAQPDGSQQSCCVTVHNVRRNLFFLPRETLLGSNEEEVTLKDVYEEVAAVAAKHQIAKFGCKKVARRYAFEIPGIPMEADYIKMVYPFTDPALPKDLSGRSFGHVFGTGTSALELFLVKRKIMGPCWLEFVPSSTGKRNASWCRVEMQVDDPKTINPIVNGPEPPTLTVLSLSLRTLLHAESKTHEIVAASGLVYHSVSMDGSTSSGERPRCNAVFSVARETDNLGFTHKFTEAVSKAYGAGRIELAKNERALLGYLIAMIHRSDPDVIVGHNFLGFDLGVLLHRMRACKVDFWSRLGRLNWSQ